MNVLLESELTETASEGEGEYVETGRENFVSRSIQCDIEIPCEHRFSVSVLRDLARTRDKEKKYFSHLTGFSSYEKFRRVLEFALPRGRRKNITYWNTKASKEHKIDTSLLFDSDQEAQSDDDDEDDDGSSTLETDARSSRDHVLSVEDEFLLVMMKLRLGLTNLDLAIRFNVAEATISNTFISWLNLLFVQLGPLKIWPHRNVILEHMPKKFKEDYPNNIIIIDCTELKFSVRPPLFFSLRVIQTINLRIH